MLNVHRNHTIHTNSNSTRMVKQKIQDPNSQSCSHESNWTRWQVWFLGCQLRIFVDIFLISETKMTVFQASYKETKAWSREDNFIPYSIDLWNLEPKESQLMIITFHAVLGLINYLKTAGPIHATMDWPFFGQILTNNCWPCQVSACRSEDVRLCHLWSGPVVTGGDLNQP